MYLNDNLNVTQPTGGNAPAQGLDPSGVADESAITDAALLAELSEPDALEELENANAQLRNALLALSRVEQELATMRAGDTLGQLEELGGRIERQSMILEELTRTMRATLLEKRLEANPGGSATFHLPRVIITAKRLEQLLGVSPRKAGEVLKALRSSGLLTDAGQLSVRVELEPCGGPR